MTDTTSVYVGFWWRPGEDPDEDGQPGRLVIESDHTIRVELMGGFPAYEIVPEDNSDTGNLRPVDHYPVIHGRCGSEWFTLLRVATYTTTRRDILHRPDSQTLFPQRALRGTTLVSSAEAEEIHGVSVEIDYLLFFSQMSTFVFDEQNFSQSTIGEVCSSASVVTPEELNATWQDAEFTLSLGFTDFFTVHENPNLQHIKALQVAGLAVRFGKPRTVGEADQIIKRLQDLLTLAINTPCATRNTRYRVPPSEPVDKTRSYRDRHHEEEFNIYAYGNQIYQPDSRPYTDPPVNHLFTVREIPFKYVIPRWLDLYDRATSGIQMLAGSRYLDVGYLSSRLTTICVALEAIHTALYDESPVSNHEFEQIISSALSGVTIEEHRNQILRQLRNVMTYRQRAKSLTNKLPEDFVKTVLVKPKLWANMITEERNGLAHVGDRRHTPERQLLLMLITQLLLSSLLAKELGLTDEKLLDFAQRSWGTTSRWKEVMDL